MKDSLSKSAQIQFLKPNEILILGQGASTQ